MWLVCSTIIILQNYSKVLAFILLQVEIVEPNEHGNSKESIIIVNDFVDAGDVRLCNIALAAMVPMLVWIDS